MTTGAHHACHLGQPTCEIVEVACTEADGGSVEGVIVIGQRHRVSPLEAWPASGRRAGGHLGSRPVEHRFGEVGAEDLPAGADAPGKLDRKISGPGGKV
jgi:hypothetical protein